MTGILTSPHNPRVRAAAALRDRRGRDAAGRIVIDGGREVLRALEAGLPIETAFVAESGCRTAACDAALALARRRRVEIVTLGERAFERVAFGDRADGIVAVGPTPETSLDRLEVPADPLVVVLEGVEKPGNLGAVLRSIDGAGADALIVTGLGVDLWNPNAIRASLGTIFRVPVAAASAPEALAWLRARSIRVIAARVDAQLEYTAIDLRGPLAIALGSETSGLSDTFGGDAAEPVRLPMHGAADSLNVSVAAAVLLYEARRQRGAPASRSAGRDHANPT